ncbi:hypothetical protein BVRB_8g192780 [Beta vulgaris subsp. vulgaris]|nr:hypothetical protein BVRB_8g192780 [Beta vulgaris subsp. vulgaris]
MGAADQGMFLQYCVFDSSISSNNSDIQRRPYHRNCGCALHHQSRGICANSLHRRSFNVSYPIRRSWSEGTLTLALSSSNTIYNSCYCSSNIGDNYSFSSSSASPSSPVTNYSIN